MRYQEFTNEVAMNPAAYADSMAEASERGVLVGFEFEVLVPREAVARLVQIAQPTDANTAQSESDWINAFLVNMYDTAWSIDNEGAPAWWSRVPVETWDRIFRFKSGALPLIGDRSAMSVAEAMQQVQARKENRLRKQFEKLKEKEREKVLKAWNASQDKQRDDSVKGFVRFLLNGSNGVLDIYRMGAYSRMYDLVRAASEASESKKSLLNYVLMRLVAPMLNAPDYERRDLVDINLEAALAATPREVLQVRRRRDRYDEDSEYDVSADGMAVVLRNGIASGSPVKVFSDYHQSRKALDTWYIEPDGSLEDPPDGASMEVVSPPLPVPQAISVLKSFMATARELGLETDESTGLHINISIPGDLDILKLIVFSGDEHVLKQFGREESEYAQSVYHELRDLANYPDREVNVKRNDKIIKWLSKLANRVTDYHSASVSRNRKYISFRHAGDDYLADPQSIVNVMGRFVRAMMIAATPTAYRKEYLKQLSALMGPALKQRKNVTGTQVIEPSSAALLWIKRNGWPALQVFGDGSYQAKRFAQDAVPGLVDLKNFKIIKIPPAPEDLTLPRDLKKWAMIPTTLSGVDILMQGADQIKNEYMVKLVTIPINSNDGQEIYRDALALAQQTAR